MNRQQSASVHIRQPSPQSASVIVRRGANWSLTLFPFNQPHSSVSRLQPARPLEVRDVVENILD
jgi:hypothetical protein